MNYFFTPSPRPSSLEILSDEQLMDIYEMALQAKVSPDFIALVELELTQRQFGELSESC
ncbi:MULTISPECIES: sporulation histidine kinase inhibitor Sda [Paenibacillus]|uniref:sporulation histidine kinase inhibitor Sda n=1 Tax=Paenibacillus TaxID=44249 RepID=UPI001CC408A1|nr:MULTISPECIES: sporulation histidine kinase inhibitor Sda [Paenibacillus]